LHDNFYLALVTNSCKLIYSQTWGENFGSSFSSAMSLLSLPSRCQMRVEEVQVTFGKSQTILWLVSIILQLRLKIGNGNWSYWTDVYGGNNANGTLSSFVVPDGENIKTVLMRSGARIDRLQFITDYFITIKVDGEFLVLEEIDETKWIEWIVLKDNTTRKNFFGMFTMIL